MTLHVHKVDDSTDMKGCTKPMHVPPGWQIADGSADDVRVCTAHPWQTSNLIFADGLDCGTAKHPYSHCRGTHPQPSYNFLTFASHLKIVKQGSASNNLFKQDAQGAIVLQNDHGWDVLLRRRA
jgi:hypothetical protein